MPSINDVLKEKFNVTGNNIAETLSKIEPGSGGGAVNWLGVNISRSYASDNATYTMDKTAQQIIEAFPCVYAVTDESWIDDADSIKTYTRENFVGCAFSKTDPTPDPYSGEMIYAMFSVELFDTIAGAYEVREFKASSPDDYPVYNSGK